MVIIGDKEVESGTISVRGRKDGDIGSMTVEDFTNKILDEITSKSI